jgi:hypothetical protein
MGLRGEFAFDAGFVVDATRLLALGLEFCVVQPGGGSLSRACAFAPEGSPCPGVRFALQPTVGGAGWGFGAGFKAARGFVEEIPVSDAAAEDGAVLEEATAVGLGGTSTLDAAVEATGSGIVGKVEAGGGFWGTTSSPNAISSTCVDASRFVAAALIASFLCLSFKRRR